MIIIKKFKNKTEYYKDGKVHRDNDLPAIEYIDGTKCWCQNGFLHRDNGPAIEYSNGDDIWYQHGKLHRLNGPAKEYANGKKKYYLNGKSYTKFVFNIIYYINIIKNKILTRK
jgi:hypothetical protein